jgi:cytochrome c-type biogenesis protein CcmH/NrfG
MFFPRLRRQAKWMFVFLALVFGGGFVIFGVGSNLPSGLGDILQDVTHDSAPSVSEARDRVRENPRDPEAYLALSDAFQQNQRPDDAIAPLRSYLRLRPRDEDALRELAGLYSAKANRLQDDTNVAALQFQVASTGQLVQPNLSSGPSQQGFFQAGQIETQMINEASERYQNLLTQQQGAARNAQQTYQRLARLDPRDPQVQLLLASSAEAAGNVNVAIAAYEHFLKIAPEDSSVPAVKRTLRDLREQAKNSASATPVSGEG